MNYSCDDEFIWRIFKESPYTEANLEAIQYIKKKIGFSEERIERVLQSKLND